MKLNAKGISILHQYEDLRLEAYLCPAGIPTIGWGNTYYEDGTKVKLGEKISKQRANVLFENILNDVFIPGVRRLIKVKLNKNQFSALVSFAYNVGLGNFKNSTLLKRVNINPNDPDIAYQFSRWNKSKGKVLRGLTKRRKDEAGLYFS